MATAVDEIEATETEAPASPAELVLRLKPVINLSDREFLALSSLNSELRMERSATGELIVMTPTGGESGEQNAEVTTQLRNWAKRDGTGRTFDSSTGFRLPNGAIRSPDASWVASERLSHLTRSEREGFLPLCPDFVIEIRSRSDRLASVKAKMAEYIENGARLGWLVDSARKRVFVYIEGSAPVVMENPEDLSGDPVLPGFTLDLGQLW